MHKSNVLNNKKGMSLIFVVLVMLVLSILSGAIFTLFTTNMNIAQKQENIIRAHYLALSGVDITFAALYQGTSSTSLLNTYFNKPVTTSVASLSDTLELESGIVNIEVSSFIDEGNRWVLIESTGTLNDGSNLSQTVKMKFRVEYPEIQLWE